MTTRRLTFLIRYVLVLAALLGITTATQWLPARWDLTEEGRHTLSETSRRMVASLNQDLIIELLVAEDLPPQLVPHFQQLTALLQQYRDVGGGKIQLVIRHPANDEQLAEKLEKRGIQPSRINQVRNDRVTMVELWYAMRLRYGTSEEVFPDLTQLTDPEYQVTAAILRLTWDGPITVALVGPPLSFGNGGYTYTGEGNLKKALQSLRQTYAVELVPVLPGESLNLEEADAAFVWGLDHFEEPQLYQLEQWLLSGKPATLLVSGVAVDPVYAVAGTRAAGDVDNWFKHLGFRIKRALVADQTAAKVRYTQSKPPVLKEYPLFPELSANGGGLGEDERAHAKIDSLVVPWCSPLQGTQPAGITTTVIGRSSTQSWLQTETFQLDPAKVPGPTQFDQYVVGLKLSGRYEAYFTEPPGEKAATHLTRGEHVTLRVWGSEFLLTSIRKSSALVWVNQTADAMTRQSLTAGIPRRGNAARPLRALTHEERDQTRTLSLVAAFLLPTLIGSVYFIRRRLRSVNAYL